LVAYVVLLGYGARAAYRVFRRETNFNAYFVALFATWVAYLIQAAISINQVGVGIWGWLFTGALIGYEIASRQPANPPKAKSSKPQDFQLPATAALLGIAGFIAGFFLSFIPFNADARFKDSLQTGNPAQQLAQSKALGATAYHMELALDAAIKANDEALASEITTEILNRYPRDFMAWRVKQVLAASTPSDREEAYEVLKSMDPFNPEIQPIE
jgi:hypothetical protein